MRYQNELFQSITSFESEKNNNTKHLLIALTCMILITTLYAFFATKTQASAAKSITLTIPDIATTIDQVEKIDSLTTTVDAADIETPGLSTAPPIQSMQSLSTIWHEHKINSGESLSAIFSVNNLDRSDLHKIIQVNDLSPQFAAIRTGKSLLIGRNISGEFTHLVYKKSIYEELKATRVEDGSFTVELITKEIERRIASSSGIIHASLFIDGKNAGLTDNIIMQLANIFAWDIDVALSLHEGDKFSVIYENLYIDNKLIGSGNIIAAEFTNQGKSIKTVRYQDEEGKASYYTPEGDNMRKAFL